MQSVNELCEKGNSLSEVGMYQEALSCFKHALEKTPEISGFENLKMLSEIKGSISDANIAEYMNYFDLDPEEKKPVRKYSQGMKQKLGIIQAIMENQKLLVLDEPFNALDEKSVKLFRELLIEYKKQEKLIILTSHNKEDIESLCDHTYQIQSGQIIAE